jgi:hypothetical protein
MQRIMKLMVFGGDLVFERREQAGLLGGWFLAKLSKVASPF